MSNVVRLFEQEPMQETDKNYVVFSNDGELDIRAVKTMGMSAKDNPNAIGYFGTGLKYAIAVLLRNKQSITIYSGNNEYRFTSANVDFRGKGFEIVSMNGDELGFTTDLGKNWEMWQAYRELACNATDEGGEVSISSFAPNPQRGKTIIVCEGDKIEQCYEERGTIILEGTPLLKSCNVAVYHGGTHTVFYKHVKALQTLHCLYTYSILSPIELTEDRTIKYSFYARGAVMNAVLESHNRDFIKTVLTAPKGTFEATFDFMDTSEAKSTPSKEFIEVSGSLASKAEGNASAFAMFRKHVSFTQKPAKEARLTDNQKTMFDRAIRFCNSLGYDVENYPIIITHELGHDVLGLAKEGKIYINIRSFQRGLRELAATLIEEFIHLDKGLQDESRAMQNYLFERLVDVAAEIYNLD
jgi:hypothetical protein